MNNTRAVLWSLSSTHSADTAQTYSLSPEEPCTIGRGSDTQFKVLDPGVSRRHAQIIHRAGEWQLTDLNSRHGTSVNGHRLGAGDSITLKNRDVISFGEWKCSFQLGDHTSMMHASNDPIGSRVEPVDASRLSGIAQERLSALIDATRNLALAKDRVEIASIVRDAAVAGTGSSRVFVVSQSAQETYEFLAPDHPDDSLSQGLLRAAASTGVVELFASDNSPIGQSIMDLGIRSAICAPMKSAGSADALLYLDTRGDERTLPHDSVAFCASLADLGGLAIERVLAADMEARRAQIEQDIHAARNAQELLMPARTGQLACAAYAYHSSPGRYVAGDFFDIMQLTDRRVVFFLGDVSGKGAAAGVVMAAAQGQIRALLQQGLGLSEVMASVNTHLCERTRDGVFITLACALWDADTSQLQVVDAGHGFCCVRAPGQGPELVKVEGGMPLGVMENGAYPFSTFSITTASRVLFWSDGAVEQPSPDGVQFGVDAVLQTIASGDCPGAEVDTLAQAVSEYAAGPLADDLTIASIELSV
jgi:serine phosphatase RsbU (regulator of sigma subunit)